MAQLGASWATTPQLQLCTLEMVTQRYLLKFQKFKYAHVACAQSFVNMHVHVCVLYTVVRTHIYYEAPQLLPPWAAGGGQNSCIPSCDIWSWAEMERFPSQGSSGFN